MSVGGHGGGVDSRIGTRQRSQPDEMVTNRMAVGILAAAPIVRP
jgi:hypothetical protein